MIPYVQTLTLIMQFVVLFFIGLNFWSMRRTLKSIDKWTELIGHFRWEVTHLTIRIELLEQQARRQIVEGQSEERRH